MTTFRYQVRHVKLGICGTYATLARPSSAVAPFTYRSVAPGLFNGILGSTMHSHGSMGLAHPTAESAEK